VLIQKVSDNFTLHLYFIFVSLCISCLSHICWRMHCNYLFIIIGLCIILLAHWPNATQATRLQRLCQMLSITRGMFTLMLILATYLQQTTTVGDAHTDLLTQLHVIPSHGCSVYHQTNNCILVRSPSCLCRIAQQLL